MEIAINYFSHVYVRPDYHRLMKLIYLFGFGTAFLDPLPLEYVACRLN
jgi:hypothetical protein